jgi:hypothetical protein
MDVNVPVNWTTPLPSWPLTTSPDTEIGEPPKKLFGPPASNVGASSKVNEAGSPGAPRLQIANTGFVTGEANVMVLTAVELPLSRRSSPTVLGEAVTVPPVNVLFGDQMGLVPFVVAPSSSPEYETPTPPSEPAADPGAPPVALVQFVQIVVAEADETKRNGRTMNGMTRRLERSAFRVTATPSPSYIWSALCC